MKSVIERVKELQGDANDEDFAKMLGTSRSYWNTIKNNQATIGLYMLRTMTMTFASDQKLQKEVNIFLFGDVYNTKIRARVRLKRFFKRK